LLNEGRDPPVIIIFPSKTHGHKAAIDSRKMFSNSIQKKRKKKKAIHQHVVIHSNPQKMKREESSFMEHTTRAVRGTGREREFSSSCFALSLCLKTTFPENR
jgi:uncharacterized phage-like protein YoqJ